MQPSETFHIGRIIERNFVARPGVPLLAGFFGKFMLDILPAALASVIGGFLFTQYQAGHPATRIATEQVTPASAEMMAMVRDEHAMMMDYLKSQMTAEQKRDAAEDAASARAEADAKAAADNAADTQVPNAKSATEAPVRQLAASQPAPVHTKKAVAVAAAAPSAPLVIAQAEFTSRQDARPQGSRGGRDASRRHRDRRCFHFGRPEHRRDRAERTAVQLGVMSRDFANDVWRGRNIATARGAERCA
jgi:hypothetical protein